MERYKKDQREIEEFNDKVHAKELQHARDSYLKLHSVMEATDNKEK